MEANETWVHLGDAARMVLADVRVVRLRKRAPAFPSTGGRQPANNLTGISSGRDEARTGSPGDLDRPRAAAGRSPRAPTAGEKARREAAKV